MNPRIHTVLAFVIGLIAFSFLFFAPVGRVAAATQYGFLMQKTDGTPEVWLPDSTGVALGFDFDLPTPASGWQIVGLGDFDGDGNPDILFQNTDGTPGIWFLKQSKVVQMVGLSNPGSSWKIVGIGDFNGDGKADILWQATDGTPGIWLMSGSTPIAEAGLSNPGTFWQIVGVGDFNGDGKADILWQGADGTPGVWLMNGTTPIAEAGLPNPGSGWKAVGFGDFNGDGRTDIVWQYTDGTPSIWLMSGTSYSSQVPLANPGSDWKIKGAGDFDGDGQSDILWQSTSAGTPGIWLMNGTTPRNEAGLKNPGTSWKIITTGAFGASLPLPIQANDGHVQVTAVGGVQTVFDYTTDACDPANDLPDSGVYAFRSANGTVSLTGNNWPANYRSTGSSLDSVQRSCTPTYVSAGDPNFPDDEYHEWAPFGYTLDGTTVYGLVHHEWYPYLVSGSGCTTSNSDEIFGITLLVSGDGGATYAHPSIYKIAPPSAWNSSMGCGAFYGSSFSNIVSNSGYYYAFYNYFAPPDGSSFSVCIMRTATLSDASSWRTLTNGNWQPLNGQCDMLKGITSLGFPFSLTFSTYLNAFVAETFAAEGGVSYSTSTDLVNWSQPQYILQYSPGGVGTFGQANGLTLLYGSFLDPTDTSLNFDKMGQQPYLYLVYVKPNGGRDIVRQQIQFTILN